MENMPQPPDPGEDMNVVQSLPRHASDVHSFKTDGRLTEETLHISNHMDSYAAYGKSAA